MRARKIFPPLGHPDVREGTEEEGERISNKEYPREKELRIQPLMGEIFRRQRAAPERRREPVPGSPV